MSKCRVHQKKICTNLRNLSEMVLVRRWIGRREPQNDEIDGKSTVGELKKRTSSATACSADNLGMFECLFGRFDPFWKALQGVSLCFLF